MKMLSMCVQFRLPEEFDGGVPDALRKLADHLEDGSERIDCGTSQTGSTRTLESAYEELIEGNRTLVGSAGLNEWCNEAWMPFSRHGMRVRPQFKVVRASHER